jgi:hypothetical protein
MTQTLYAHMNKIKVKKLKKVKRVQMVNEYMLRSSTSLVIMEIQNGYHQENKPKTKAGNSIFNGIVNWCIHYGNLYVGSPLS